MILSNIHTHSTYSDGKNTPKEIIEKAIELNFISIGFSEHAECGYEIDCKELMKNDQLNYNNLLSSYNEKYPTIQIFKGLELDSLNPSFVGNWDYTIGSVHFLKINDDIYPIDYDAEHLKELVELCGGEKKFLIKYYEDLLSFAKNVSFDIIGHFDLYTKFNEQHKIFHTSEKWYLDLIKNVVEELTNSNKIIEINTGAISRGYRTSPYPDFNSFKILKEFNSKIIVSSDSHSKDSLNCGFDLVEKHLKENNISQIYYLTPSGFVAQKLN